MARTTYYVAMPFVRTGKGRLIPGDAIQAESAVHAERIAEAMSDRADRYAGAIAFSRSGDSDFGDWDDAAVIRVFGSVADINDATLAA